jgi:hypothetical protein
MAYRTSPRAGRGQIQYVVLYMMFDGVGNLCSRWLGDLGPVSRPSVLLLVVCHVCPALGALPRTLRAHSCDLVHPDRTHSRTAWGLASAQLNYTTHGNNL